MRGGRPALAPKAWAAVARTLSARCLRWSPASLTGMLGSRRLLGGPDTTLQALSPKGAPPPTRMTPRAHSIPHLNGHLFPLVGATGNCHFGSSDFHTNPNLLGALGGLGV